MSFRPSTHRAFGPLGPLAGAGLAALMLLLALPADAQWRWRDASGRVTISDLPPPHEIPEKDILQRPAGARAPVPARASPTASAASAPAPATAAVDKALEAKKRAADQQEKDKAQAEEQRLAAVRADNCSRARSHLATMESGQRIARVNAKGEREFLDDEARAGEIRRAREVIASDCR
ncbi:MAG: DUF4124 domain-containing protein [Burkholderiales bacterium]|nr:DUF4124 domain-containing protein [Burkholderiales bacterium]